MLSLINLNTIYAQKNIKNLKVFISPDFNPNASITVEGLNYDTEGVGNYLKNALLMEGFKVISERVAKETIEIKNKAQVTDTTLNQDISVEKTINMKSIYATSMRYSTVSVLGCGNLIGIANLSGQIIDLSNDGNIVVSFTYKMSTWNSQCADTVMESLVDILKKGKSVK